ncbi:hypothetical protein DVH05_017525 [Phytophthora capsici]|nr:hypothetical protein DVH05_017525 [Phytophthora capsici]
MSKRVHYEETSGDEDSPPAKTTKPTSICEYCNKTFTSRGLSLHQRKCSTKLARDKAEAKKTRVYKFCILNEYIHEEILSYLSNQTVTKLQLITGDHYKGCEPELAKICCKCENDNFSVGYGGCRQCLSQERVYNSRDLLRNKQAKVIYGMTEKDLKTLPYEEREGMCLYERATLDKFVLNFSGSKKEWLRRIVKMRTQRKKAEVAKSRKKEFCDFLANRVPLFDPGLPSVSARLAKTRVYMDLKTNDEQWYPRFNDVKDLCDERNVCLPIVLGSTQCKDFILNGVGSAEEVVNGIFAELNHSSSFFSIKELMYL